VCLLQVHCCHELSLWQAGPRGLASPAPRLPRLHTLPPHLHVTNHLFGTLSFQWLLWRQSRLLRRNRLAAICATLSSLAPYAALRLLIPMRVTMRQFKASQTESTPRTVLSRSCLLAPAVMSSAPSTLKAVVSVLHKSCMFTSDRIPAKVQPFTHQDRSLAHHAHGVSERMAILHRKIFSRCAASVTTNATLRSLRSGSKRRL
jgi:hypothetical protein